MDHQVIDSLLSLEELFGVVGEAFLRKEVSYLHLTYQAMIKASPFLVLATAGPNGLDASPRGDPSGFVSIHGEKTLYLPERRGNTYCHNRLLSGDDGAQRLFGGPERDFLAFEQWHFGLYGLRRATAAHRLDLAIQISRVQG